MSPVTHTEMYQGVDVEPSTAPPILAAPLLGFPASYDLRSLGDVTPVKDQASAGTCWIFATYGSLESTILVDGGPVSDFSENHLKNYHGFDPSPTSGGNSFESVAYLSRWDGPVRETDDPYHDYDDRPSPGGAPQYYVREMLEFDTANELKNGVMTQGGVVTYMYIDGAYYNSSTYTYYYNGTPTTNHAVTIVGWDDAKVVPSAPGPGAWLIKNSWGTGWGDAGYFWLSYYDTSGGKNGFCFCDAVPASTYQKVYSYDFFGSVNTLNTPFGFNAFTATSDQDLRAVQFWTQADGATYDLRIYDTFSGGTLSGLLGSTTGTTTYAGLHTIDLPTPVHLTAGNDFYVYINITNGGSYPLAFDYAVSGWSSSCTASPGQSYYSFNGTSWTDLNTWNSTANFCIKALVTATAPPEITVLGGGVAIADGDITPSSTDGTDFGSVAVGSTPIFRTFTVRNDGTGTLALESLTVPTGFTVTEGLSSTLASGASDTFTVRLDTDTAGTKRENIVIRNDDNDEHPFNFAINGVVQGPEITVLGNNTVITDGDTTPTTLDGTDFGKIALGGGAVSHTFTVRNDGSTVLTLGAVVVPTGFTLTESLAASLAAGASDTFTVRLDTATAGLKSGEISFTTNDYDESPFNFAITGTVAADVLDPTFGTAGKVTTDFRGPSGDWGYSVARQADGKIIVAGYTTDGSDSDFALARYNANGSLDTSFDGDGKVVTPFGSSSSDQAYAVVLQSDGKIVVVGNSGGDFALARYNPDGSLDTSFDGAGKVTTPIGSSGDYGYGVVLQPDGKIVVAGYSYNGSNYDFAVARYNANGSLDTSFGGTGKVTTPIGSADDHGYSVAIQSDGKIVVAGDSNYDFAVVRYNADGSLDTSFDGDGKVTTPIAFSDYAYSVVLQSDGKIVVAGDSYNGSNWDFAVVRYNTSGSLDTSFNGSGKATSDFGSSNDYGYGVALQADGKIVAAGYMWTGSTYDIALARYNTNGSLDTSFDGDGKVVTPIGSGNDYSRSIVLQSDGKIVVAGYSYSGSNCDFAVVRYNANGSLDTSFDADGCVTTSFAFSSSEYGYGVAVQSDGKIVLAGYSWNGSNYDFALVRYNAGGSLDTTFDGDGLGTTDFASSSDYGYCMALQPDGKILVAGYSNGDFALARYNTNGSLDTTFDGDGKVTTPIGSSTDCAYSVILQADGKIVAAGYSWNGSNYDFAVARYNSNGSLDTTFDGDGKLTTPLGSADDYAQSVALQADGKIVVAGYSYNGSNNDFAVARYNANGSLDTSFNGSGKATLDFGSSNDYGYGVAVQADGKVVVAGYSNVSGNYDFALVRYNTNGSLDTSFDGDGKVLTPVGPSSDYIYDVVLQPDGKIVAAGYDWNWSNYDFALVRYNPDGSPDTSFGGDGRVITPIGSGDDCGRSVALQTDGKIVVAGYSNNGSDLDFAVVRVLWCLAHGAGDYGAGQRRRDHRQRHDSQRGRRHGLRRRASGQFPDPHLHDREHGLCGVEPDG